MSGNGTLTRLDKLGYGMLLRHVEAWQLHVNRNLAPFRVFDFDNTFGGTSELEQELRDHCRVLQTIGEELLPENYEGIPDIHFPVDHHLAQGDTFLNLFLWQAGLPHTAFTEEFYALSGFFKKLDRDSR